MKRRNTPKPCPIETHDIHNRETARWSVAEEQAWLEWDAAVGYREVMEEEKDER